MSVSPIPSIIVELSSSGSDESTENDPKEWDNRPTIEETNTQPDTVNNSPSNPITNGSKDEKVVEFLTEIEKGIVNSIVVVTEREKEIATVENLR